MNRPDRSLKKAYNNFGGQFWVDKMNICTNYNNATNSVRCQLINLDL